MVNSNAMSTVVFIDRRKQDRDLGVLLTDPNKVEEFLHTLDEPWVDWLDFSTIERFNDDPSIADLLGQSQGIVVWELQTTDGADAYVFLALDLERGEIRVAHHEPDGLTMWRLFRPVLDRKLAEFGIERPSTQGIQEYKDQVQERLAEAVRKERGEED
jgi:hypothetical protein